MNLRKWEEVGYEEKGPQDRALRHSSRDWGGVGFERFELDDLSAAREIREEPVTGGVSNSNGGESTEEDVV